MHIIAYCKVNFFNEIIDIHYIYYGTVHEVQ